MARYIIVKARLKFLLAYLYLGNLTMYLSRLVALGWVRTLFPCMHVHTPTVLHSASEDGNNKLASPWTDRCLSIGHLPT